MFKRNNNTGSKRRNRRKSDGYKRIDELVLPASRLKFTSEQLQNLNFIFQNQLGEDACTKEIENNIILARSVTERLVQRLVCGAGELDNKFTSKFLIHLHTNNERTTNLQYLVRLDKLSRPALYKNEPTPKYSIIENDPDFPKGYARIRMFSSLYKLWGDYANANGYLRRDKIQTRFVSLLAQVVSSDSPNCPTNLDESLLCGSPGKVVDACTLQKILKIPPEEHLFYGSNGNIPRFPDPRDFRLAIVDEPNGIRLRIEFLSPALSSISMDVRLLIAIEADAWPASTDFPSRIPLWHTDSVLYQLAAQTGVYLVGFGVQSSAWQMRFPAAEETLIKNFSPDSSVRNILKVTDQIREEIYEDSTRHQKFQLSYKILNNYILKTCLFYELEKDLSPPTQVLLNWTPKKLSTYVLKILDNLILSLRNQRQPNYFFSSANLLANPGHLCEDDYIYESKRVLAYLVKLFDISLTSTEGNEAFEKILLSQELEISLLTKWKELIDGLLPPASTRGRRFCIAGTKSRRVAYTQYTGRQLEYIALVLKNALVVKNNVLQPLDETWEDYPPNNNTDTSGTNEDLIYILLTIIEQAKDHFLKTNNSEKIRLKLAANFDTTILKLIEFVRKTNETIDDDIDFVKVTLKWLYRALDQNKRLLAPILRPYLNILFISSHGSSWFLESIKKRIKSDEIEALGIFAKLVNDDAITPAQGLIDCINKGWIWSKDMLKLVEKEKLRLVFIGANKRVGRHVMSVPKDTKIKENIFEEDLKFSTLPKKSYFCTLLSNGADDPKSKVPWHCILRDNSPMTKILQFVHRSGDHRCGGDIVQTLMSMQKLNVLHDISSILPKEDRSQLIDLMQKMSIEKKKNTMRKRAQTLPNYTKKQNGYSNQTYQKYTKTEESAGIKLRKDLDRNELLINKLDLDAGSLIQSCRTARIRDDSTFDSRIRTQIRNRDSFKY